MPRCTSVVYVAGNAVRQNQSVATTTSEYENPEFSPSPLWWVKKADVDNRVDGWQREWLLAFKDVTSATNERTVIATLLPKVGVGHTAPVIMLNERFSSQEAVSLLANINCLVFDYVAKQKVGGLHVTFSIFYQLPVLPQRAYTPSGIEYIASRVLELVYTAYDLKPYAEDMGYTGEPFRWDEERRALLRAELDAYYAKLYGLTRDELRYILDPQDVYGPDFPGETFRVLKEKEIRQFGEYRTRRLVLEAWDRLEASGEGREVNGERRAASGEAARRAVREQAEPIEQPPPEASPRPAAARKTEAASAPQNPAQPALIDFGLYQCGACGKMVMGFDRENHAREMHKGKGVEWRKVK